MAHGNVFRAPYEAARGLIAWAIDLWPYVNGKSIAYGVRLKELPSSDMLDVIHFLFEEDLIQTTTSEAVDAKDKARSMIYEQLYGRPFAHAVKSRGASYVPDDVLSEGAASSTSVDDDSLPPVPLDPFERSKVVKPYFAPTKINDGALKPFGQAIDEPLS